MKLTYLTDIEGHWHKLADFVDGHPLVRLNGESLELADDTTFIFGGDIIDRGAHARRLMRTFITAKKQYKERVILLAGNRDINKLRLWRELQGHTPYPVPEEVARLPRPDFLRWLFRYTMNAPNGLEFRRQELGTRNDEDAVDSFLIDVKPGGLHVEYLSHCQLAFRAGSTLFVHGSVTDDNLYVVPEQPNVASIDAWVQALNAWYRRKLDVYADKASSDPTHEGWNTLISYQAPLPRTRLNQASVVYSRHADETGNPELPSRALQAALIAQGIHRVVVGHSPIGDVPALLRGKRFQWLLADNSYSPLERGARVIILPDSLQVSGQAKLTTGEHVGVDWTLRDEDDASPLGLRVPQSRYLVKSPLAGGWLLGRHQPHFLVDQVRVDDLPTLEEPAG